MIKRKKRRGKVFKAGLAILILLGSSVCLSGCDKPPVTDQEDVWEGDWPLNRDWDGGELNSELRGVIAFGIQKVGDGPKQIVAIKGDGTIIKILRMRSDADDNTYLTYAGNYLFFADEEDDCLACIDLTKGDGNYELIVISDKLYFDRITGIAIADHYLCYGYADEIAMVKTINFINLIDGKRKVYRQEPIGERFDKNRFERSDVIVIRNFDRDSFLAETAGRIEVIDVKTDSSQVYMESAGRTVYSGGGRMLYCQANYDEDDYEITLSKCFSYQKNPQKNTTTFEIENWVAYEVLVVPYQGGYIFYNNESGYDGGALYYYDNRELKVLLEIRELYDTFLDSITLIATDTLNIIGWNNYQACYHLDISTKKAKEMKAITEYYDVFYVGD